MSVLTNFPSAVGDYEVSTMPPRKQEFLTERQISFLMLVVMVITMLGTLANSALNYAMQEGQRRERARINTDQVDMILKRLDEHYNTIGGK